MVKGILARRATAAEARLEHERLTSLVNSMADGVLAVDEHMHVVESNGAALNILDVNNSMRGRRLSEILKLQNASGQPIDVEILVKHTVTPTSSRDYQLQYDDKSVIKLYVSIAPVHLGYGQEQRGFVLLLRDITREKSLEEERDEFISVISHELRTPLAIAEGNIGNALFIVDKAGVGGKHMVKDALGQAHDQILFLAGLVNDLSMLSRADRGKLKMEVEPIAVPQLVEELLKNYLPDAKRRKLKLTAKVNPDVQTLTSSVLYVREVLQNFITNALKYTEKGSVTLRAEAAPGGVRFSIQDSGIGISKSDQTKLFDKFFRSEDYRTRKTNGTGLGLYVTLKLSRLLHADISVDSELNKGSTFSIFIPNLKKNS
ncbi:MAG TPA: ATP-binding protein [Candidatus Saccharimonadales bacterium]|nr:ATP-binding protein [Candidatus Saccharimonadales bacterium]